MKLTAKTYDVKQGTQEWLDLRSLVFTASEVGAWIYEEKKLNLEVKELTKILQNHGIAIPPKSLKGDLEKLLPDPDKYKTFSATYEKSRMTLIRKKMALFTKEGQMRAAEANGKLEFNFDIKRGNEIEPIAREVYSKEMGFEVIETGFLAHESCAFDATGKPAHGFGCSPDGLIADGDEWSHGLESKAPSPEKLLEYIDENVLPSEYEPQVQMSMAVSGLKRWDFIAYCPQLPPFIVTTHWSEKTDRCLANLKSLHADFVSYRAKIGSIKSIII